MSIAVLILTHNEAQHIARAIASVASFSDLVVVVDSFSTDRTVEIAREHGAIVYQNPWKNYADQFSWGQSKIPSTYDWIMRLDADEIIEPDLAERLRTEIPTLASDVTAVTLDRKHIFMGRWIRHGGRYPLVLLRLFRNGRGRIEQRWMDEHIIVDGGKTVHITGGFSDDNLNNLTFFTDKHNKYATREAIDILGHKYQILETDRLTTANSAAQATRKRFLKEYVYNKLPFWAGPTGYFLFRFIFQLGFLDGPEGVIYHFLQGFWYRFLVAAKVREYEIAMKDCHTGEDRLQRLEILTGHRLRPAV